MLEESASYYSRKKKKRMSMIPTMMKEEMGLAIKGERERSGFGNEGVQERNVAIYTWVLW